MPGPSEFMVGNAPGGAPYAPPSLAPFLAGGIAGAPDNYVAGLKAKQQMEWMKPVLGPDGQPLRDPMAIQQELMRRGGGDAAQNYVQAMMPFMVGQALGQQAASDVPGGGASPPAAPWAAAQPPPEKPPSNNHPQGAGPSNIDPSLRPQASPTSTTPAAEGASYSRPTVRQIARGAGDESLVADLARSLRVGPDSSLTEDQAKQAADYIQLKRHASAQNSTQNQETAPPRAPTTAQEASMSPNPTYPGGVSGSPAPLIGARETTPPLPSGIQPYGAGQAPREAPVMQPAPQGPQVAQNVPQPAPQRGNVQPTPGPPTGSLPPGYTEEAATQAEAQGRQMMAKANQYSMMPKGEAASNNFKALAQQQFDKAKVIREAIAKQQEFSPEERTAARLGQTVPQYEGAKAQQAEDVKTYTKLNTGIQALANSGVSMLPTLDAATSLINAGASTGWAAEKIQTAKQILARIGGDPGGAMTLEAFGKQMAAFINEQTNTLKAEGIEMGGSSMRLFQAQISNMQKASPAPEYTPAGNRYLIEVYRRGIQRAVEIADQATKYATAHGGRLDAQFEQQMRTWQTENPMFNAAEMKNPRLVAAPMVPQQIQTKAQLKAWEKSAGLRPGDAIRVGPGQYKTVQ